MINEIKAIGNNFVELSKETHFIERCKLYENTKRQKKKIYEQTKPTKYLGEKMKEETKNWNEILYTIHRRTGISIRDIKNMSVNEFYYYRENLKKERPNGQEYNTTNR